MACTDFKDLARRTASDEILGVKAFNNAKNPKYDGYKEVLIRYSIKFWMQKILAVVLK